jgi:agmatinase
MRTGLLGVGWDDHSSHARGPARAPAVIRAALQDAAGNRFASDLTDVLDPDILHDHGDCHLAGDGDDADRITAAATAVLEAGDALLTLGGDHAVTYPVMRAVAARWPGVRIVHVDAHPDLYDDFEGDPLSHASPFARIMEQGLAQRLLQIGIRADTPHLRAQADRFGVRTYPPDDIDTALMAIAALGDGPVYLSFDLDGLDPAFAPGVNHHEPGGLTVREALRIIEALPGRLVGADVVELAPARDVNGTTATVAARLVKEIVARIHRGT